MVKAQWPYIFFLHRSSLKCALRTGSPTSTTVLFDFFLSVTNSSNSLLPLCLVPQRPDENKKKKKKSFKSIRYSGLVFWTKKIQDFKILNSFLEMKQSFWNISGFKSFNWVLQVMWEVCTLGPTIQWSRIGFVWLTISYSLTNFTRRWKSMLVIANWIFPWFVCTLNGLFYFLIIFVAENAEASQGVSSWACPVSFCRLCGVSASDNPWHTTFILEWISKMYDLLYSVNLCPFLCIWCSCWYERWKYFYAYIAFLNIS